MISKATLLNIITKYINEYTDKYTTATTWGTPLLGVADAYHPYIQSLPNVISSNHDLPQNVLPQAKTILVYYVPFTKELAKTNKTDTALAAPDWARAYEETNSMFNKLNHHLISHINDLGYLAAVSAESGTYDHKKLISNWSYRHLAYAAGLGTFGLNNMLITKAGCCGRFNAIVTNLDMPTDKPLEDEYCLFKKNGTCKACALNCPASAITTDNYDRNKCYKILRKNAEVYTDFGSSYSGVAEGSEVCGKCITQSPCAFKAAYI